MIHEVDIEKEEVRRLFRALEGLPITFNLFADGHVLTAEDRWRFLDEIPVTEPTRIHIKEVRTCYPGSVEDMIDAAKNICRINIFYLDNDTRDRVWEVVDSFSDLIRASSQPCNVEVTKNGAEQGSRAPLAGRPPGRACGGDRCLRRLEQRYRDAQGSRRRRGCGKCTA